MAVADVFSSGGGVSSTPAASTSKLSWGDALAGGAGIGGALASLFGGGSALGGYADDMTGIENDLEKYYREGMGYLTPYSQTGTKAMGDWYSALQDMQDPTAYYNKIMSSYNESPFAQFQRKQGLEDIASSAASRGLLGSTAMGRNLLNYSQGLSSKDMQDYYNNIMGQRKMYLGGLEGLTGVGESASTNIANLLSSLGQNRAELEQAAAQAKAADKASKSSGWGSLLGAGLGAAVKTAPTWMPLVGL